MNIVRHGGHNTAMSETNVSWWNSAVRDNWESASHAEKLIRPPLLSLIL